MMALQADQRTKTTNVFKRNVAAFRDKTKRRAINEGGTASSKTWSILQLLIFLAQETRKPLLISVVSETLPHLKKGCIRDFFRIMGESEDHNPRYHKTDRVYTFGLGKIEFFGADDDSRVKGARRQILFINEANNVSFDTYRALDVRTETFVFMDWNPNSEFWAHEDLLRKSASGEWEAASEDTDYIHSTYLDGLDVLPQSVIDNIESYKGKDPNWWNVYGLGLLGKVTGLVYPFFQQVDRLPAGDPFYGLDFGFGAGNPLALTKHVIIGDNLFSHQLIFKTGLTNKELIILMVENGVRPNYDEIFADSEDPKAIQELYQAGFNVKGVSKGAGSVAFGEQLVRQYNQYWTKDSTDCIKEQRNHRYIQNKDGGYTDKSTHQWSHGMDSRRYGVMGRLEFATAEIPPEPSPKDMRDDEDFIEPITAGLWDRGF